MEKKISCPYKQICPAYQEKYSKSPFFNEEYRSFCDNFPADIREKTAELRLGYCPFFDLVSAVKLSEHRKEFLESILVKLLESFKFQLN